MRKIHKMWLGMLSLCLLFALTGTAFAEAATPYYLVRQCPRCIEGDVTIRTTRKRDDDDDDDWVSCKHREDRKGFDVYEVWDVETREKCNKCDYDKIVENTKKKFLSIARMDWDNVHTD